LVSLDVLVLLQTILRKVARAASHHHNLTSKVSAGTRANWAAKDRSMEVWVAWEVAISLTSKANTAADTAAVSVVAPTDPMVVAVAVAGVATTTRRHAHHPHNHA